jgi:selenide,water dikinase
VKAEVRLTSYSHGGGCACKLGGDELAEVMSHLSASSVDPALLVGLDSPDDAAVYKISDDVALVQTVDFFTPIVDDPYTWGRIAAANALSDVYAMGGIPRTALNLVAWPRSLDFALLGEVLKGGEAVCTEAGVSIVGGHSVDDPEPKYGLAVTGTIHPDATVRKVGAAPGSALVLTKPIGTGIISSAIKGGTAPARAERAAIESMTTLNRAAAEAMTRYGATAGTDVTGFGLMGHLLQMLEGRIDAEIDAASVPLLPDVLDLVRAGVLPGGSKRNRDSQERFVEAGTLDDALVAVMFDAQTSGGLLIAVDEGSSEALVRDLQEAGHERAARIGTLTDGTGRITLV